MILLSIVKNSTHSKLHNDYVPLTGDRVDLYDILSWEKLTEQRVVMKKTAFSGWPVKPFLSRIRSEREMGEIPVASASRVQQPETIDADSPGAVLPFHVPQLDRRTALIADKKIYGR